MALRTRSHQRTAPFADLAQFARFWTVMVGAALAAACSSNAASPASAGVGGDASGGNPSAGASGAGASGTGTPGSGGNAASGGTPSNGGTAGGSPSGASGATSGSGGKAAAGGVSNASGGKASSGGAGNASGGSSGSGGSGNTGGQMGSGGAAGAGGQAAAGGSAGSGGANWGGLDHELLGVYCGNTPSDFTQFETWFGHHADGILGYTGNASWDDFDGSVGWATGNFGPLDRRVLWSVPLIPTGANLTDAAAGMYDDHYLKAAKTLAGFRPQESILYIRTGWEFNGDWFPWAAKGKAKDFAGAFQHFVSAFRSVSSRFKFEWNVNVGDVGMNPEDAYPGDASVDIIGMDFYWNTEYDPKDPMAAWNSMMTRSYGLKWHQDFATAHGKPTAYSEWGVMSDAAGPYIQQAKAWFASHAVVYQTYWNSDSSFTGKLSSGQYPNAGAAYRAAFAP